MSENRRLLLKAVEHNWDESGPGEWQKSEWHIFDDGSYDIFLSFEPSWDMWREFLMNEVPMSPMEKKSAGMMEAENFANLCDAMRHQPWRDPSLDVHANDGVAWEIESYREDGSVENTSGKTNYIYGDRVLETIVSFLPPDGNDFSGSAYVSIRRKSGN